jgi:hypothetical protein
MPYANAVKRAVLTSLLLFSCRICAACCLGLLPVWIGLFMKNLASEIL